MPNKKLDRDLVEWRPEWKGEDLEYYNRLRGELETSISTFRSLREQLGLSQAEVAKILATTQSNVSKMECRPDSSVRTLSRVVQAKGGTLTVVARFEGKEIELPV